MTSGSQEIEVRKPTFALDETLPHYWFDGQPFATHFLNGLSSVFPDGEAFFVRSVHHYQEHVSSKRLRADIAAFAAQEGQHSHQHRRHLELLMTQGYRMIAVRNRIVTYILRLLNRKTPRYALAMTAALEHLTALLARQLLSQPDRFLDRMDPRMAPFWRWHALEEAEHKAVAFDVLMLVAPGRIRRTAAMMLATFGLFVDALIRTIYMLWVDGNLWRRDVWRSGWRFLFGSEGGFLRGHGHDYRRWYRRDFHPDDVDDRPLIEAEREMMIKNREWGMS